MRVLVLGGNGFIGSHIVDELLLAGHEVSIFDRSLKIGQSPIPSVEYFYGNFSDGTRLADSLHGVDVVVHSISSTTPSTSNLDPLSDIQNNLVSTVKLLQLMLANNIKRIIYISSGGVVYGSPTSNPVPETHALDPICSYGVIKVATEMYLKMYAHLFGLQPMIIRPSNVYGPRQGNYGIQGSIATFMRQAFNNKKISIWGDGTVKRDYLFVTDLAKLCRLVIDKGATGVLNAGCGAALSLNEILDLIRVEMKKDLKVEYFPSRVFDVKEIALDITRAQKMFDWLPSVTIQQGLALNHQWLIASALHNKQTQNH